MDRILTTVRERVDEALAHLNCQEVDGQAELELLRAQATVLMALHALIGLLVSERLTEDTMPWPVREALDLLHDSVGGTDRPGVQGRMLEKLNRARCLVEEYRTNPINLLMKDTKWT